MALPLRLLDLFSGIGGFSLGLERSGGFKTVAFCEIDPFCRAVIMKHWPNVVIYEDVRMLTADKLSADGVGVDAICGGFPCQDISFAGKGEGLSGERSGLWAQFARLIRELLPRVIFVENVAALLGRGIGDVLGELASLGYDAEWRCIPAWRVGLPHSRERVWITAYRNGLRKLQPRRSLSDERRWRGDRSAAIDWVLSSGGVLRSHDGIPAGLDRIGAIGNAVVPQIAEMLGMEAISCLQ